MVIITGIKNFPNQPACCTITYGDSYANMKEYTVVAIGTRRGWKNGSYKDLTKQSLVTGYTHISIYVAICSQLLASSANSHESPLKYTVYHIVVYTYLYAIYYIQHLSLYMSYISALGSGNA